MTDPYEHYPQNRPMPHPGTQSEYVDKTPQADSDARNEIDLAYTCAGIISNAAARLSKTDCAIMRVDKARDFAWFWVQIIVGIDPFDVNRLVWEHRAGGFTEWRYAHVFRLRVPMSLAYPEQTTKLRQIGESLADIWWESCGLTNIRTDRRYHIPHIGQDILGTRTLETEYKPEDKHP
jgi:hypothetical protein